MELTEYLLEHAERTVALSASGSLDTYLRPYISTYMSI